MDERERMIVEFYQRYKGFFMRMLLRRFGALVAEDILHDAMLKLLTAKNFDVQKKGAKTYMSKTIANLAYNAHTYLRYRSSDLQHYQNGYDLDFVDLGVVSHENAILAKIDLEKMFSFLRDDHRDAFVKRNLLGYTAKNNTEFKYKSDYARDCLKLKAKEMQP